MSETCATCVHWRPPSERADFYDALTLDRRSTKHGTPEREAAVAADEAAKTKYGECQAIRLVDDHPLDAPLPLATVRDASDYVAVLYSLPEFGCALHSTTETPKIPATHEG